MQSSQVANQARIFASRPEASARLNTVYMTGTFVGGSGGSAAGAAAWALAGWNGVCAVGGALALTGLVRYAALVRRPEACPSQPRSAIATAEPIAQEET
jgi:hypothetical protein